MNWDKVKIRVMGEEISHKDLEHDEPPLEDYFVPVVLSALAIDKASQIVPENYWKPHGLHTWLSGRANEAFKRMTTSQTEIVGGKLKYTFEMNPGGPVLKNLTLV